MAGKMRFLKTFAAIQAILVSLIVFFPHSSHGTSLYGAPPLRNNTAGKTTPSAKPGVSSPDASELDRVDFSSYIIGPEDVLKISVWKDDSLTKEELVKPDGYISFPLIGQVMAKGKTVDDIQKEVTGKMGPYISDPNISVEMVKVNYYKVYVIGRVNKPGEFLVGHPPDVLQVLSMAGGLTPYANENSIKVIRRKNNKQDVFYFRYGDIKSGRHLEQNILLMPGDEVIVP